MPKTKFLIGDRFEFLKKPYGAWLLTKEGWRAVFGNGRVSTKVFERTYIQQFGENQMTSTRPGYSEFVPVFSLRRIRYLWLN